MEPFRGRQVALTAPAANLAHELSLLALPADLCGALTAAASLVSQLDCLAAFRGTAIVEGLPKTSAAALAQFMLALISRPDGAVFQRSALAFWAKLAVHHGAIVSDVLYQWLRDTFAVGCGLPPTRVMTALNFVLEEAVFRASLAGTASTSHRDYSSTWAMLLDACCAFTSSAAQRSGLVAAGPVTISAASMAAACEGLALGAQVTAALAASPHDEYLLLASSGNSAATPPAQVPAAASSSTQHTIQRLLTVYTRLLSVPGIQKDCLLRMGMAWSRLLRLVFSLRECDGEGESEQVTVC